jgi:hypothetical protein
MLHAKKLGRHGKIKLTSTNDAFGSLCLVSPELKIAARESD